MTISTTSIRNNYDNSSGGTIFAYTFKIFEETDIQVSTILDGTETIKTLTTDYTVDGVGDEGGGNVTFTSAVAAGTEVAIVAVIDRTESGVGIELKQETDLVNETGFFQDRIEDRLDIITRQNQIIADENTRSLRLDTAYNPADYDLEIPPPEAGAVIGSLDGTTYENITLIDPTYASGGTWVVDRFTDGVGFTAGSSTTVTLSTAPAHVKALTVSFDGILQHTDTLSLAGSTLTFNATIPGGVSVIEVKQPTVLAVGTVEDDSISTTKLQTAAVTAAKIAPGSVSLSKIADAAISSSKILDSAVTTNKIADGNVTAAKLGTDAVTTSKILNAAVTAAKIATGVVPTISQWTDAGTITLTATTSSPTKGVMARDKVFYRRVGDTAEIRYEFDSAAGIAGTGDYLLDLPAGLSIDTAKVQIPYSTVPASGGYGFGLGSAIVGNGVNAANAVVVPYSFTKVRLYFLSPSVGAFGMVGSGAGFYPLSSPLSFTAVFSVPISGWTV